MNRLHPDDMQMLSTLIADKLSAALRTPEYVSCKDFGSQMGLSAATVRAMYNRGQLVGERINGYGIRILKHQPNQIVKVKNTKSRSEVIEIDAMAFEAVR